MEYAVASAICIGVAGGAFAGYLCARTINRILSQKSSHPRVVAGFIVVGFLAAMPTTLFLSLVVGGNIGGGSGAFVSEFLNLGSIGVPVGLAVGVAVVLAVGLAIGAVLGGIIGYGVSLALKGKLTA